MLSEVTDTTDLKEAFALQLLLCHNDALRAAKLVSSDLSYCLFIATHWPSDLYVLGRKKSLLDEHGAAFFLPTKYDIAHKLVDTADRALVVDDKLRALKLYAEVMGMIEKPGMMQNNVTTINENRVMLVPTHGNNDEWQRDLLATQRRLVADA